MKYRVFFVAVVEAESDKEAIEKAEKKHNVYSVQVFA